MAIARHNRIYGKKLGLTIAGKDYWADVASYELAPDGKGDPVTFGDAATGATPWKLKIKAIQSTDAASFWSAVWDAAGTDVTFAIAPHGNKTASATQPHFTGKVTIGAKPPISSEAGDDKGSTFEVEWDVIGEPEKKITGSTMGTGNAEDS